MKTVVLEVRSLADTLADAARAMLVRAFLEEAIEIVSSETAKAALEEAIAIWWTRHGIGTPGEGEAA